METLRKIVAREVIFILCSVATYVVIYTMGHLIDSGFFLLALISLLTYPLTIVWRIGIWAYRQFLR